MRTKILFIPLFWNPSKNSNCLVHYLSQNKCTQTGISELRACAQVFQIGRYMHHPNGVRSWKNRHEMGKMAKSTHVTYFVDRGRGLKNVLFLAPENGHLISSKFEAKMELEVTSTSSSKHRENSSEICISSLRHRLEEEVTKNRVLKLSTKTNAVSFSI